MLRRKRKDDGHSSILAIFSSSHAFLVSAGEALRAEGTYGKRIPYAVSILKLYAGQPKSYHDTSHLLNDTAWLCVFVTRKHFSSLRIPRVI
jgi:hypothetical protein